MCSSRSSIYDTPHATSSKSIRMIFRHIVTTETVSDEVAVATATSVELLPGLLVGHSLV